MSEAWDSFFVAETAAAAALLGLLFVAVSINLKQVIETRGLPDRALGALMLLLAILILGLLLAMPDQTFAAMGGMTVAIAAVTAIGATLAGLRGLHLAEDRFRRNYVRNIVGNIIAMAPIVAGGLIMFSSDGELGFYLVGVGMCLSIVKAVTEGWVFLIEINR
jgi:modulator of FtsH protease